MLGNMGNTRSHCIGCRTVWDEASTSNEVGRSKIVLWDAPEFQVTAISPAAGQVLIEFSSENQIGTIRFPLREEPTELTFGRFRLEVIDWQINVVDLRIYWEQRLTGEFTVDAYRLGEAVEVVHCSFQREWL